MHKIILLLLFLSTFLIKINDSRVLKSKTKLLHHKSSINYTVPRCDGINEYFSCGSPCQSTCKYLREPCLIKSRYCVDSCYCLPGYARDDRNSQFDFKCIPEWQCENPKGKCLGKHEVFESRGSPCQTNCARLGLPCPIFDQSETSGCYCKAGFARDENANCIPQHKCSPGRCSDIHEVYKAIMCPKYCENIRGCPSDEVFQNADTQCTCQIGYVRRFQDDKCVPERTCYGLEFQ